MRTLDIIRNEHQALAAVLQALQFVVGDLRACRRPPDFVLLAAMIEYIAEVPEKVHHLKEDRILFPRLRERSPAAAKLIDELESEHGEGQRLTGALKDALIRYQAEGPAAGPPFGEAVQGIVDFNWRHLRREERELLPLAERCLLPQDWAAMDAEFAANGDPYAGPDGRFAGVFRKIVHLTPPPYGLGRVVPGN